MINTTIAFATTTDLESDLRAYETLSKNFQNTAIIKGIRAELAERKAEIASMREASEVETLREKVSELETDLEASQFEVADLNDTLQKIRALAA